MFLSIFLGIIFCCRLAPGHVTEETEEAAERCLILNSCCIFLVTLCIYIYDIFLDHCTGILIMYSV